MNLINMQSTAKRWIGLTLRSVAVCTALVTYASTLTAASEDAKSSEYWRSAEPTTVEIGPGLALFNGNTGWAINVGMLRRVSETAPLFAGVDFAFNFWNFNVPTSTVSSSATGIQLLPTLVYGLRVPSLRGVHPYIGVSMGPHIYAAKQSSGLVNTSTTTVFFEGLVRVGARVDLSRSFSLNLEPKFGILRSEFIFLPQANLVVSL